MNLDTFNEIAELRDKRDGLVKLLDSFDNEDGRVAVEYYSVYCNEFFTETIKHFKDLQNELNDVVKNWIKNKINEIDNVIKEL